MVRGKPVIGCNVGGIPEIITDGITGILVPPDDSNALAKSITSLLRDKNRRMEIGKNASLLVRKKYSVEIMSKNTLDIYNDILCKKSQDDNSLSAVNNLKGHESNSIFLKHKRLVSILRCPECHRKLEYQNVHFFYEIPIFGNIFCNNCGMVGKVQMEILF